MATKNLNNHNNKTNNKSTLTPIFNKNIKNNPQNSSKSSYAPQPRKNPTSGNLAYNLNSTNSSNKNRTTKSNTKTTTQNSSKSFMSALEDTHNLIYNPAKFMSDHNLTLTENGAVAHSTSGSALLDMNFSVSSLRGVDTKTITTKFSWSYSC